MNYITFIEQEPFVHELREFVQIRARAKRAKRILKKVTILIKVTDVV